MPLAKADHRRLSGPSVHKKFGAHRAPLQLRCFADDVESEIDVAAGSAKIDDTGTKGKPSAQNRVRDVSAPAALHRAHNSLVQLIQLAFHPRSRCFVGLSQNAPRLNREIAKAADA
jgi:hypothetical protein